MNRPRQARWWLALCAAGQLAVFLPMPGYSANTGVPVKLFSAPTNSTPPLPQSRSPVDFFRNLLAMSPSDRENFLTNKPPEARERILAKVNEYSALPPDERELRLRATELRWYLVPLLRESPTNRASRLARVPDDIRGLVNARLMQWEILSPPLQQEFLENERTLHYFAHVDAKNNPSEGEWHHAPSDAEQSRWNALSESERQNITAQFNRFFELTPLEEQKTLNTLSGPERLQMEKTLQAFDKLSPPQRTECVHAFTRFAGMSRPERTEFLKYAQRWTQMSPAERKAWRDLVANVPQWPPLPPSMIMPPPLPPMPGTFHSTVATNHG